MVLLLIVVRVAAILSLAVEATLVVLVEDSHERLKVGLLVQRRKYIPARDAFQRLDFPTLLSTYYCELFLCMLSA